jgi:solute carrier family 25 protein 38
MDAYPPDYARHNLPFIVLSGLDTIQELDAPHPVQDVLPGRATTTINSELPPVTGELAQLLLDEFQSADGSDAPWNGRGFNGRGNLPGFRIRTVGRVGQGDPLVREAC